MTMTTASKVEVIGAGIKALLSKGTFYVTFTKTDKSLRRLRATLDPELLPMVELKEADVKKVRIPNAENVSVYDVDLKEWRSFKIDNLVSIIKE